MKDPQDPLAGVGSYHVPQLTPYGKMQYIGVLHRDAPRTRLEPPGSAVHTQAKAKARRLRQAQNRERSKTGDG